MGEDVILDRLARRAQRLEFGQPGNRAGAPRGKTLRHQEAQRFLQRLVAQRARGVRLEVVAGRLHQRRSGAPIGGASVTPASTSATWRARIVLPRRDSLPAMLRRQPRSPASTVSAPVASMSAALSLTMRSEIAGYLTQN